jgi:non-heme Fe2+,alpha-ketoglutarate-dependent halogenase
MTKLKKLSPLQRAAYERDGFVFPIDVMSAEEVGEYRHRFEKAEMKYPTALNTHNRNNAHISFTCLDELVHHGVIVDAVEDIIGSNVLASGTVLFIKEPTTSGFVSWHQDFTYMGFEPHDGVTAWLALTPSTIETGCMQMIPASHLQGLKPHRDTFEKDNLLTRGQVVDGIDETTAVSIELQPGQMSLHHPRVIHGSQPNTGHARRFGFATQAYIPPHVHQTKCAPYATLVRGEDTDGTYSLVPRPKEDMSPHAADLRQQINGVRETVLYEGTTEQRKF